MYNTSSNPLATMASYQIKGHLLPLVSVLYYIGGKNAAN